MDDGAGRTAPPAQRWRGTLALALAGIGACACGAPRRAPGSPPRTAGGAGASPVIARVGRTYRALHTLHARARITCADSSGASGTFIGPTEIEIWFQRPGRYRVRRVELTRAAEIRTLVICDGARVWTQCSDRPHPTIEPASAAAMRRDLRGPMPEGALLLDGALSAVWTPAQLRDVRPGAQTTAAGERMDTLVRRWTDPSRSAHADTLLFRRSDHLLVEWRALAKFAVLGRPVTAQTVIANEVAEANRAMSPSTFRIPPAAAPGPAEGSRSRP